MAYYTQDGVAVAIIHEGQRRGVSQKGIQIALSTGLVESDLYMHCNDNDAESKSYPYDKISYDYDSSGIFQQRPAYWGTAQQRMDVAHSAGMFYDALNGYNYDSDENTPGWYAYQVQKCAAEYAYRYDERYPEACEYYSRLASSPCPQQPGECPPSGPSGPLVSRTADLENEGGPVTPLVGERVLDYDHSIVPQETGFWCGPASCQVVLNGQGVHVTEQELANQMGTDESGTDYVGLIEDVLDQYVPAMDYHDVYLENDPATQVQRDELWAALVGSINTGGGVVMNWVSPPGNHPVGIKGSQSPNYGGGTIFHYVAAMGYDDNPAQRAVWIADSGFQPFGYWISFDQCSTLIPPKGYCYAAVEPTAPPEGEDDMAGLTTEEHDKLMQLWGAFFNPVASASEYAPPDEGEIHQTKDMLRYTDGNIYSILTEHRAMLGDRHFVGVVKAAADRGNAWAKHVYDLIPAEYK